MQATSSFSPSSSPAFADQPRAARQLPVEI
ncbi:hypothetical protein PVAP13_9KG045471 [Panicum virgatum]|uniref:Uncharacterized protein n=1 Tax=Panicum virgatum TaxID=38727 RepID=A0A8T0NIU6_PANVG|nr:hypothetical protein PVAP13_9KG045471 [Panicum virgatum]